ncbi:hypothetical protein CEUSTIGMA_g9809.t1 [Chlamydomonas eustigma]|uniref:Protein kinase domain-containing protein n=1 Tax=Chlamydomonas eustigma TaxID=1157962 RepID=A0A250XH23_9CHLO|nr:hypothetical protein CEUSTIGMA_g9809.t1 [Chlamydomonas eustigma]|eukprot:GAX82381.1 hypothetical protein CEUSTIGMA_g9809.t1 [Chlamydomonas eustigma]
MKWLSLFKKRREERTSSPSDGEVERDYEISKNKASNYSRSSLDQWFIARKQRTSIPELCNPTTTARLQICKAGVTTLINRKYVVIKHLGSGTYGQVKLAFNLLDKKLYAVKACRKSQVCNSAVPGGKNKGHSKFGSFKLRRSSPASITYPPADNSSRMQVSEPMSYSTGINSEPISTSSGSLVATARSMPLNVRPADSLSCPWATTLDSLQPSGTNRQSVQSDKVSNVYQFDHSSQQNSLSASRCAKDRCPSTQNVPSDMKGSLPSGTTNRDNIQKAFDQVKAEQFVREVS